MNISTRRRLHRDMLALALTVVLAQPLFTPPPAHAALDPAITDGSRFKTVRAVWDKYGPVIITLAWEVLTDWMTSDPPRPVESPPQDPDFEP